VTSNETTSGYGFDATPPNICRNRKARLYCLYTTSLPVGADFQYVTVTSIAPKFLVTFVPAVTAFTVIV
jgi:hypothetical protein